MIYLHTGQPGAGKSLYTIWHVAERAKKEQRPVFYSGIADCKVPGWTELEDATEWATCGQGAIIVIDEAQRIFRPRQGTSAVPVYVAALETHRHRGFDIYVITQHPTLVEANVRRLVGTHRHIMRAFGSHAAIVHEWNEVRTDCDTKRDGSLSSTFRYPKEAFQLYKSAEVHTHKARVPMRVWLVIASPFLLFAIGFGIYKWIAVRTDADAATKTVSKLAGAPGAGKGAGAAGAAPSRRGSGVDWYAARAARVADLPHTAPVYDEVTAPRRAPYPAMCIATAARCVCYTQDGTKLGTSADTCRRIAVDGFFKDWDERTAQGVVPAAASRPTNGR